MLQCFPSVDSSIITHIFFSSSPYLFRYKPSTKLQSVLTGEELLHFPHIQSRSLGCSSPSGTSALNEMKFKDFLVLGPPRISYHSPPGLCCHLDSVLPLTPEASPLTCCFCVWKTSLWRAAGLHPSSTSFPGRRP